MPHIPPATVEVTTPRPVSQCSPSCVQHALGVRGEHLAEDYFLNRGARILAKNWRAHPHGELDLVIEDAKGVAAVEVKTRSGLGYGRPLEAITRRKVHRMRRLITLWARTRPEHNTSILRIDALGILVDGSSTPQFDYLRGVQ